MGVFDPKDMVLNLTSSISARLQLEKEDIEFLEGRSK